MLAEARNAQWTADTFLGPGAVRLIAPAKVNLFLAVGERRGTMHETANVMHALGLHDVLHVNMLPAESACATEAGDHADAAADAGAAETGDHAGIAGRSAAPSVELPDHVAVGGPADNLLVSIDVAYKAGDATAFHLPARENIVFTAMDALAREAGCSAPCEMRVRIEKNIPHQAGLGGGSTDAAAALLAAAHFWGIAPDDPSVCAVAERIGADVAFFLHGGCARFTGFGEQFACALRPEKHSIVLVKPAEGVSTAAAYEAFDEQPIAVPADLLAQAEGAQAAADVPLLNNLAPAAERLVPELAEVRRWLADQPGIAGDRDGRPLALLSGSGACTYAICRDFASASAIAAAAKARGLWARATTLSPLRAMIVGGDGAAGTAAARAER